MHLTADEFVRRENVGDGFDHRMVLEVEAFEDALVTDGAEDDAFGSGHVEGTEPHRFDPGEQIIGVGLRGFRSEDDDHWITLGKSKEQRARFKAPPTAHDNEKPPAYRGGLCMTPD